MTITRLKPHRCPHCGKRLNAAGTTDGADARPEPGDCTMCFGCGEWCVFADDLSLRKPSEDELVELLDDPDCQEARRKWLLFQQIEGRA